MIYFLYSGQQVCVWIWHVKAVHWRGSKVCLESATQDRACPTTECTHAERFDCTWWTLCAGIGDCTARYEIKHKRVSAVECTVGLFHMLICYNFICFCYFLINLCSYLVLCIFFNDDKGGYTKCHAYPDWNRFKSLSYSASLPNHH